MSRRDVLKSAGRGPLVQAESRLRVSVESDAAPAVHVPLRRALHATIHESTASTLAIAEHAKLSYQLLCNAANASLPSQRLRFDLLPLVLEACDDLTLVRFLAALQHAVVIRLPKTSAGDVRQASATMREFVEFMDAGAAALDDHRIEPREFSDIEREGLEAVRAILATIEDYRRRVDRPLLEGM